MDGTKSYKFDTPAYTYNEAEGVLGRAFGFGLVHQRGVLRQRIKHLQRLGLVELNLGKKKRAEYSHSQIALWMLALVLAETGLDPTLVVNTLKKNWRNIVGEIELATSHEAQSGRPYYLCLWPRVLSAPIVQKPALSIAVMQIAPLNPFTPGFDELRHLVGASPDNWFCIHNITRICTRLENALPRRI